MTYQEAASIADAYLVPQALERYGLVGYAAKRIDRNFEARNVVYCCEKEGEAAKILRISYLNDRSREDLLAETEYVRYLYEHGGSIANVINSVSGNLFEELIYNGSKYYVSLFVKAKGILFVENGYRYREGIPVTEYFFNIGKTLGKLHQLSKGYTPVHRRHSFLDRLSREYIHKLIPDSYALLKSKLFVLLDTLKDVERNQESFGMIHFDFNDGNYSIDYETGRITVYDFDNSCFGWYMYELGDVWANGVGFAMCESDPAKRKQIMDGFFETVLVGYRSETPIDDSLLEMLPLFIKATEMEAIVDRFEDMKRSDEDPGDDDRLSYLIKCVEDDLPYKGFYHDIYSSKKPFTYKEQKP